MTATLEVHPAHADAPYVLALDVGSSGTRSGIYDRLARPARGFRAKRPHASTTLASGASTIDGLAGPYISSIEGDHHNVVGLSLPLLRELLAEIGLPWRSLRS